MILTAIHKQARLPEQWHLSPSSGGCGRLSTIQCRGCAALNMGILIVTGLLLLLGTSSLFLVFHNGFQDLLWPKHATMPSVVYQRKLKEGSSDLSSSVDYERDLSKLNFKDYRIVDPIPGTPGTTGSGTIEHGAPLNPWTRTKGPHPPPSHF